MPKMKDLELILPSYDCNRDCPYCTAKITRWYSTELDLDKFSKTLDELIEKEYHFKYFILCGNGEPSLYPTETLLRIFEIINSHNTEHLLFDNIRIQTSGNLFSNTIHKDVRNAIKGRYIVEITRAAFDYETDSDILRYKGDYINSYNFSLYKTIRLNIVILKGMTGKDIVYNIKKYKDSYPNIKYISIKTLNLNTRDGDTNNPYSEWIIENAVARKDSNDIVISISQLLGEPDLEYKDRFIWKHNDVEISLYTANGKHYGDSHLVYYGDKLIDFELNKITLSL